MTSSNLDTSDKDIAVFGTRIVNLQALEDVQDRGDYVILHFSPNHRPPYLYLFGNEATEARRWLEQYGELDDSSNEVLSIDQLEQREIQINQGIMPSIEEYRRLLTEIRRLRQDRDRSIRLAAQIIEEVTEHYTSSHLHSTTPEISAVQCTLGEGCIVRSDGSCHHTDRNEYGPF